jgi:hypothetical protein
MKRNLTSTGHAVILAHRQTIPDQGEMKDGKFRGTMFTLEESRTAPAELPLPDRVTF